MGQCSSKGNVRTEEEQHSVYHTGNRNGVL